MPFKDLEVRRIKQAGYSKTHYEKNKKKVIEKINAKKKINKEWFVNYKKQLACVTCGHNHPAALDFHHVEQKKSNRKFDGSKLNVEGQGIMTKIVSPPDKVPFQNKTTASNSNQNTNNQ
jgi:hypothetical protein